MPNHWHLLLWPSEAGQISEYMRLVTVTHVQRWHAAHRSKGAGALYQGRFKACPVQSDEHYWTVLRYIERNPLRANLVEKAENWRWSSLRYRKKLPGYTEENSPNLTTGPVPLPENWLKLVQSTETEAERVAWAESVRRGLPFGDANWIRQTAKDLNLESLLNPIGRPKKQNV